MMRKKHFWVVAVVAFVATLVPCQRAKAQAGLNFVPLMPCRLADTRSTTPPAFASPNGPPGVTLSGKIFQVRGLCGVPTTAQAASLMLTVVGETAPGFFMIWPAGGVTPSTSNINFVGGEGAVANGAVVLLGPNTGPDLASAICCQLTDVIIDVTGYYQ